MSADLGVVPGDDLRRARLNEMKRAATALLVVVAVVFVVTRLFEAQYPWLGYLRAFSEAAMVGGIADWFAVTALFRHPLGIPIPHTAIVPARKDRIGAALGNFVQRNFLARDVVAAKLSAMRLGVRAAGWLTEAGNSRRLARAAAQGLAGAAAVVRDEEIQSLAEAGVISRLRRLEAGPLVAKAFELLTADGRHQALLDEALQLAARFLAEHDTVLRERIREESPWWVPGAVEHRLGDKILQGVEKTLAAVAADPQHPLRARYDGAVERFVLNLRENPETIARAERIKDELLAHPEVGRFTRELWQDVKARLGRYVDTLSGADGNAEGETRAPDQLERWFASLGDKVLADPVLAAKVDGWIIELISYAVEQARDEVAALITSTVGAWDADATSRKIELQIGRDLQFIRINGTLVGGLVGVLLHALGTLL